MVVNHQPAAQVWLEQHAFRQLGQDQLRERADCTAAAQGRDAARGDRALALHHV